MGGERRGRAGRGRAGRRAGAGHRLVGHAAGASSGSSCARTRGTGSAPARAKPGTLMRTLKRRERAVLRALDLHRRAGGSQRPLLRSVNVTPHGLLAALRQVASRVRARGSSCRPATAAGTPRRLASRGFFGLLGLRPPRRAPLKALPARPPATSTSERTASETAPPVTEARHIRHTDAPRARDGKRFQQARRTASPEVLSCRHEHRDRARHRAPRGEMDASIDELAVNTIRTLAMDAVQAANSGHPGTPMAMAPVAYTLWQRFLRFDPDDPIWPNRDRFVLSIGHASMLLYSLLHLTGVKAVNPAYERLGELAVPLDDIKRFRQLDSDCPGHPEYRWTSGVETTTGPLGQGVGDQRRHGDRRRLAGRALQPPRLRAVRLRRLRALRRRRHDGGHLAARRPRWPATSSSRTSAGSTTTTTSRSRAAPTSRSARTSPRASSATAGTSPASATPTTSTMLGARVRDVQERARPADADHRRQPHRLRRAAPSRTPARRTASRSARRRSGSPRRPTAGRRTRSSSSPTACASTSPAGIGERGRTLREAWMEHFERYKDGAPRPRRPARLRMQRRELPDGWDTDIPSSRPTRRAWPAREASGKVLNAIAKHVPVAARRRGRPRAVDQDAADVRGRRRLRAATTATAATSTSASASTRWARSSTACRCRRCAPYGSGFLIFSDYGRAADPAGALMEIPVDPHLHPRLDRRRRGRPDPPADRAARVAARDARR